MGKRILSTSYTMDVSSQSSAPVAPAGTMRMRPKSDGSTLQLSYNGGAYFDMSAVGGSASVRLDQVLDPTSSKAFAMSTNTLAFDHSTAASNVESWKVTTGGSSKLSVSGTGTVSVGGFSSAFDPFFDLSVTNRLRVGSPGVQDRQLFYDSLSSESILNLYRYANDTTPAKLLFQRARGTFSSPSDLANLGLDEIGSITFWGRAGGVYDGPIINAQYISNLYTLKLRPTSASTPKFEIDPNGFKFSAMQSNGILYNDTNGYLASIGSYATNKVLKSSSVSTSFPPSWGTVSLSSDVSGTLGVGSGGTGLALSGGTLPANGSLLIGNGTNFTNATLTAGANVTITNAAGAITIASTGSGGGALPAGSGSELQYRSSGSAFGAVTSSSVSGSQITVADLVTDELTINGGSSLGVYYRDTFGNVVTTAGGTTGQYLRVSAVGTLPTFAALNMNDASAGTLAIARGGTALGTTPTNGQVLIGNGTNYTLSTLTAGTNISLTNGAGSITINSTAAPGGSGTELQYRSGASTFGALSSSSVTGSTLTLGGNLVLTLTSTNTLLYSNASQQIASVTAGSSGQFLQYLSGIPTFTSSLSFVDNIRQTFNPGATNAGINVGAHPSDPGSPVNGDVYYNSSTNLFRFYQNSGWTGMGMTVAGSGTELQYRSSATALAAVSNSSVSGSVITLGTSTDFTTLQGAAIVLQGDNGAALSIRTHSALSIPLLISYRSRGTNASKTAVQSGDALYREDHYGYYDSTSLRIGGQTYFTSRSNWSSTEATAIYGVSTNHGTNVAPLMRQILGGFKILTDNTLADLFTFSFAAADHKAAAGEIELILMAKQTTGSNEIACYRRVMNFTVYHRGATNTGALHVILNTGGNTAIESTGTFDIKHTTGSSGSEVAITTALLPTTFDTVTYKVLVDSSFTVSTMYCFFNVKMNGEVEMALA